MQGGGCTTVGVAGLVQSGGFGSFSKHYGTAAGGLLEAEVVTADGKVRVANACTNPDLFWALKGGGEEHSARPTRVTGVFQTAAPRYGYKARAHQPESAGACGEGHFLNSDVQFVTRLSGAVVSSVDIVSTTNLLPSGVTSKVSLNKLILVCHRVRSETT